MNQANRNYNVITLDESNVYVETYRADKYPSNSYKIDTQNVYEITRSGIFLRSEIELYEINIDRLKQLAASMKITEFWNILQQNTDYSVSDLIEKKNVQVPKHTLFRLSVLFEIQLDTLIKLLKDETSIEVSEKIDQGIKDENQIYIKNLKTENIVKDEIVKNFIDIRIYDVEFRQEDKKKGIVTQKPGKYITIKPTSGRHGAVVLPIDDDGKVLLVNQFRHSTERRKFFTEAIRGFSNFDDDTSLITALREFSEEGGGPKIKDFKSLELEELLIKQSEQNDFIDLSKIQNIAIKGIYYLGHKYTDTGKLWEAPRFYLFHVNHQLQSNNITRKDPIMESPFWVKFKYVLESIVKNAPIQLAKDNIVDVYKHINHKPNCNRSIKIRTKLRREGNTLLS